MKIIDQTSIIFIFLVVLSSVLFGQSKSITRENYYSALKEAQSKTDEQIRKRVKIQKLYTNGNITKTLTDTTEYLPPDKSRWISVEEKDGNVIKRIEQITVGGFVYRKTDNGDWIKRENDSGGFGIGGSDNSTSEFFIEETKIGKEKFQVLTEKRTSPNKIDFDEVRTWVSKKGLVLKKNSTTSSYDLKNIVSSVEVNYKYNLKTPKIEPPVK